MSGWEQKLWGSVTTHAVRKLEPLPSDPSAKALHAITHCGRREVADSADDIFNKPIRVADFQKASGCPGCLGALAARVLEGGLVPEELIYTIALAERAS